MVTMTKSEAIKSAIEALRSEATSSQDERVERFVAELEAGEISQKTLAFMDENIEAWWATFGGSLEPEESLGEMLIKQFEEARDNLKEFA